MTVVSPDEAINGVSSKLLMVICGAVIAGVMGLCCSLGIWAIQGIHETQVASGQKLAVVAATTDAMGKQVDRLVTSIDKLREQQVDQSDIDRVQSEISRVAGSLDQRLAVSLDQRLAVIEQRLEKVERNKK